MMVRQGYVVKQGDGVYSGVGLRERMLSNIRSEIFFALKGKAFVRKHEFRTQ